MHNECSESPEIQIPGLCVFPVYEGRQTGETPTPLSRAEPFNSSCVPRPFWPCFTVPHGHNGRGTRDIFSWIALKLLSRNKRELRFRHDFGLKIIRHLHRRLPRLPLVPRDVEFQIKQPEQ